MHINVSKLTIIGSDNGLSPGRRQVIIWTNAGISLIGPLGTNVSEILVKIYTFSFQKNAFENSVRKMTAILPWPQCVNMWSASYLTCHQVGWANNEVNRGLKCDTGGIVPDRYHSIGCVHTLHITLTWYVWSFYDMVIFTWGQFWPSGVVAAWVCLCRCQSRGCRGFLSIQRWSCTYL